ncbi:MAG TPA: hypothetical protein DCQ30_01175 [Acidimicrobiaceae bacterium]|nr:hypothetical protein [Acidimicrobiaceae bacterium]
MAQTATTAHTPATGLAPARRARMEPMVRRLLVVPDPHSGTARTTRRADASAHRLFNLSMALSGLRCLLGYVVLPIATPALGAAARVGPVIGIPIAVVALGFDVMAVRRFWAADHPWRWSVSLVYVVVMSLVLALLVGDIVHLTG